MSHRQLVQKNHPVRHRCRNTCVAPDGGCWGWIPDQAGGARSRQILTPKKGMDYADWTNLLRQTAAKVKYSYAIRFSIV